MKIRSYEDYLLKVILVTINLNIVKKAYFQQEQIESVFDYDGKILNSILKIEPDFLIEFFKFLIDKDYFERHNRDYSRLSVVWNLDDSYDIMDDVIRYNIHISEEHYSTKP